MLERAMLDFMAHKADVLLSTTIVENGIDIPNANTIIINRADRYGLSQLYQLRGRVGRSDRPAYAYLLIPPEEALSPVARKRLAAIKEFSDLGSGFRVAALDLEIRGAGNLLGGEQSGHIDAVGFEMYMKLLEETIRELKGEDLEDDLRATVNLRIDFRIDEALRARHEPAADDLSPHRRGAHRGRADADHGGGARSLRAAADCRCSTSPTTAASVCWPTSSGHREHRARGYGDRDSLPREGEGRSHRVVIHAGSRARRPAAGPARHAEDGPEEAGRARPPASGAAALKQAHEASTPHGGPAHVVARRRPAAASRARVVDGPRHGRRGDRRLFEGRNSEAQGRGSPRAWRDP